jgi:phosphoglycolate phosphatase-like HAD superfamily hydrolase
MRYKLIIFDLDGVILNSKEANRKYYNDVLNFFENRELTSDELDYAHSQTVDNALNYLFKGDVEKINFARKKAKEIKYINYTKFLYFEDYVIKTLDNLNGKIQKAICTNRTDTMPILIEMYELKRWFDTFVTALDVSKPKPDPEGLLKITREKDVNISETIYVGDTIIDEKASKNAEIDFIAYKNRELEAKYYVEKFFEIEGILSENF